MELQKRTLGKHDVLLGTSSQPNQLRGKLWKPFRDKDLFFLVVLSSNVNNKQVATKVTSIALSVQVLDGLYFTSDRLPKNWNFKLIYHISQIGVIMLFHKTTENANKMLHVKFCWLDERKWKFWTRNELISNSMVSIWFISLTFFSQQNGFEMLFESTFVPRVDWLWKRRFS